MPPRPLFRRPDGELVTNESPVRYMIPYLMIGRNESVCYHDELIDLTKTKAWLRDYNKHHSDNPLSLFHLILWAIGRGLHARPGMNRFVSGGRIYQRNETLLSFAAKKKFADDAPLVTIKMPFKSDEPVGQTHDRIQQSIESGRAGVITTTDKELALAMAIPGPVLRLVMALLRGLDRVNLLPKAMIDSDPMYTSCFIANLGSVGLDRTYHHLYEYGTASLFCVIGVPKKHVFIDRRGNTIVKDGVEMRWTFDERINDGFYCAASLRYFAQLIEDPEKFAGPASQYATTDPTAPGSANPAAESA